MTITRSEALRILERDIEKYSARVEKRMGVQPPHVHDGSTSFDFNTGRIHNASWVSKFILGDKAGAEVSLKSWNKGGGKVLKGLVRRRDEEADIIFRNLWPAVTTGILGAASQSTTVAEIKSFQEALKALGFYAGSIDGDFGSLTKGAVENFQRKHGLLVDGIVGPATRAALTRALEARVSIKHSVAGGGVTSTAAAVTDPAYKTFESAPVPDIHTLADVNLWFVLGAGVIAAAAIWAGWWLWRNRGRFTGVRVPT